MLRVFLDASASLEPDVSIHKTILVGMCETWFLVHLVYNKMELLQSQAPAEWVLKGLECSRIKNQETRI